MNLPVSPSSRSTSSLRLLTYRLPSGPKAILSGSMRPPRRANLRSKAPVSPSYARTLFVLVLLTYRETSSSSPAAEGGPEATVTALPASAISAAKTRLR